MTDFNEGDLVQIEKGETVVRDRLVKREYADELFLPIQNRGAYLSALIKDEWTVALIEKAKPKVLPTEPGVYVDNVGDAWLVAPNGTLGCLTSGPAMRLIDSEVAVDVNKEATDYAPFTRLEPRAVTAKAVLDELRGYVWADKYTAQIEATEQKFGVTND